MRLPLLQAALALALAAHAPASAQEADPIAALLDQGPPAPVAEPAPAESIPTAPAAPAADPETVDAEAAEGPPSPPEPEPAPASAFTLPPVNHAPPATPSPAPVPELPTLPRPPSVITPVYTPPPPPHPTLTAPTHVDETGRSPEAPPTTTDLSYESRMRSSFASAQGLQGPLDGAWTLRGGEGAALYTLQLVDNGLEPPEGAWRDPRRRGATDSSGFLSAIQRTGGELIVSFYPRRGEGVTTLVLKASLDGTWSGELEEGGRRRAVVLRRD
ncbi:hypothetical protein [Phenylobacterium sp.]|uniref:hypothetical protein n=1 Tax=Phenylobacterium sp. TaxID=1871053 RepID=UPI0027323094|nr:hypothetical protein [Phenylobacterium sp.]MDP3852177.1 hypothetical protein [Phenylobacterium sp.]